MLQIDLTHLKLPLHKTIAIIGPLYNNIIASHWKIDTVLDKIPTLYIDGALNTSSCPHHFGLTMGDGDSFRGVLDVEYPHHKDQSDFNLALKYVGNRAEYLFCMGFLGHELRHTLSNIGIAHHFLHSNISKPGPSPMLFIDDKILFLPRGKFQISYHGAFSVFTLEKQAHLTLSGQIRYKTKGSHLFSPLSDHGIGNFSQGLIEIQCDFPSFIVF